MAKHWLTLLVSFHATDAPDIPQNLSCETSNFLVIKCTWTPGRPSGLYGQRRTKYSLFERYNNSALEGVKRIELELLPVSYCTMPI